MFLKYTLMSDFFKLYPSPKYNKIIEPFGLPAHYSLLYYEKQIVINNQNIEDFIPVDNRMVNWKFISRPYYNIPNEEATWFINAPRKNKKIDYVFLASWCKSRKGQVIVIEQSDAKWLKFKEIIAGEGFWSNFTTKTVKTQLDLWK